MSESDYGFTENRVAIKVRALFFMCEWIQSFKQTTFSNPKMALIDDVVMFVNTAGTVGHHSDNLAARMSQLGNCRLATAAIRHGIPPIRWLLRVYYCLDVV